MSAMGHFTNVIAKGLTDSIDALAKSTEDAIDGILGERYRVNPPRDNRADLLTGDRNIPFAGVLHPDNPTSGVYGGMSYDNNVAERLVKIPAIGRKNYLFVGSESGLFVGRLSAFRFMAVFAVKTHLLFFHGDSLR